jgi:hypothetical protein
MHYCFRTAIIICSMLAATLTATDLKPWLGPQYSTEFNASCLLQQFRRIDTRCGSPKRPQFDSFYNFGVHVVTSANTTLELEISLLNTRQRAIGLDEMRLTGRYFLLNDIVADPVSLTAGITLSKIFQDARRNIATFNHGGIACEVHVTAGKEYSCEQFWISRIWGIVGVGIADVGLPWLRANLVWERNWWEIHQLKVFVDSIWGFGRNNLTLHPFHGYGSINYQAIDIGIRYSCRFANNALLSLAYSKRAYARNCPLYANLLKLELCYPFSL